ncbi:hypothetical protein UFOVP831_24 [uncultured Caudovirales phage]|uniref:Uncharacterized protein n=1 Tax=uncultured Caudovirales phage TaxID=2100421 RepID=A0A6J5NXW0_9CAUD|nr:hypothetical protein UFOVP831_24 [uncultured Caudovirales phage]
MTRPSIPRFEAQINNPGAAPILRMDAQPAFDSAIQMFNTIADAGDGMANAVFRLGLQSQRALDKEKDAYLAEAEVDDIVKTNEIYNQNASEGNQPEKLAERLNGYMQGKMQELPESIRPLYQQSFQKRAAVLTVKSQDEFYQQTEINAKKSLMASLDIVKEDIFSNPTPKTEIEIQSYQEKLAKYNAILDTQVKHNYITSEEAILNQKEFRKDLIVTSFKSSLDGLSDDQRSKAILKISKMDIEGLDVNEKQKVVNQLNAFDNQMRAVNEQAFAKEKAEQELGKARKAADLEIRTSRGQAGYDEITRMEQNRTISPDQKASLFKMLDAKNKERMADAAKLEKVAQALQGNGYLDPKDDKDAIDFTYINAVKPQMQGLAPDAQKEMLVNFVNKVGVVPDQMQSQLRGVFRGGDPEAKVFYADLVGRIQEAKPEALDDIENKDIAQAVMINELVKSGTPNLEAVARVEDMQKSINPARLQILKTELSEARGRSTVADRLAKAKKPFSNWFGRAPSLGDPQLGYNQALLNDYERTYESWYNYTNGDAKIAEDQTAKSLNRLWGVSEINGSKRLVKYPVEKAYPNIEPAELRKRLVADVKAIEKYKDINEEDIAITLSMDTARLWNTGTPAYPVVIKDKNGVFRDVLDNDLDAWTPGKNSDIQKEIALRKRQEFMATQDIPVSVKLPEVTIPTESTFDLIAKKENQSKPSENVPKAKKPENNQISPGDFLKTLDQVTGKEKALADRLKAELLKKPKIKKSENNPEKDYWQKKIVGN